VEKDLSDVEVETGKVDKMFNSLLILGYRLGQQTLSASKAVLITIWF
jgi:hypothetical protein